MEHASLRSLIGQLCSLCCADYPPRPRCPKCPRGSQQAVQDRRLRHVEVRQRGRRGDRDQTREERLADSMDGPRIVDLLPLHDEDRRLELRDSDVGDCHSR